MNDLGASTAEIGLVSTVASFIYGAGALAGGPLGDKIGEAKTITICLVLSGLSTFIMLAAGFTHGLLIYATALIMMSIWASLYHPTANSLISKAFKGKIAETMGLHGVGGTLGVVLTPTVSWFLGAYFGWPWAFVFFGILCIMLALIFIKSFGKTVHRNDGQGTIIDVLKTRELWMLLTFNIAIGLFMKGVELFFPTFLNENRSISPMWASIAYTMLLAAGVPAQWIGGKSADRFGSRKVLIFTSIGVTTSLLSLLLLPNYMGIFIFIALYGLSFYAHQPALNSLTSLVSPQSQRGAVYGIFFFTSFGIGSISQVTAGYLALAYGLDSAFYLFTAFALTALLLSFRLPKNKEKP